MLTDTKDSIDRCFIISTFQPPWDTFATTAPPVRVIDRTARAKHLLVGQATEAQYAGARRATRTFRSQAAASVSAMSVLRELRGAYIFFSTLPAQNQSIELCVGGMPIIGGSRVQRRVATSPHARDPPTKVTKTSNWLGFTAAQFLGGSPGLAACIARLARRVEAWLCLRGSAPTSVSVEAVNYIFFLWTEGNITW